jgi:colicin import membrane protein
MRDFLREHAGAVVVSVLLHGLLAGGMLLATYISSQTHLPAVQPIPIDAVVVDSKVLHAAQRAQDERAEQEAALARATAEAKAAQEQAEADARAAAEAEAIAASQEAKQAAKRAEEEADSVARAEAAKQAKAAHAEAADAAKAAAAEQAKAVQAERRADADKASAAAAAQAALDARRAAEAQKTAEARQAAEAKQAADAKRAAEERAKQDREAELRKQLADEERVSAVQAGPLRDRYIALLRNKIQNAWIKPPSATPGVDCLVQVTQVPGGEVTGARVTQCNGDAAVRQSIENAVYRASPLPDPPDPALFERNFVFRFKPNE